jgi:hypothetical protein
VLISVLILMAYPPHLLPTPNLLKVTLNCTTGCLFDLDADPTEHVELSRERPDVLKQLLARAIDLDTTYYQSDGTSSGDPAAQAAAENKYGGFWGPWQPDGPPLPPSPPGPPQPPKVPSDPPTGGFFIRGPGNRCLTVDSLEKNGRALLGSCDGGSKWAQDSLGRLYNIAGKDESFSFLREDHGEEKRGVGRGGWMCEKFGLL